MKVAHERRRDETPAEVLAKVNVELERISEQQHQLARRKALLQEQATRLRLGASVAEVQGQMARATRRR